MWLSANFIHPPQNPLPIRMKADGDELVIQNASTGTLVDRWPFRGLYKSDESSHEVYLLGSSAHDARIEITDIEGLQQLDWLWRLPAQKAKDPRKTIAWGLGGFALVTIGLIVSGYFLLASMPQSLESALFRNRRVFSDQQFCRSQEGNRVLTSLLENAKWEAEPIRAAVYRGDGIEAFAFPAGRIFISNGLLREASSLAEVKTLLAHLAAHVRLGHILKGMTRDSVLLPFAQLFFTKEKEGALDPSLVNLFTGLSFTGAEESKARAMSDDQKSLADFFARLKSRGEFPAFYSHHRLEDLESSATSTEENLDADWLSLKKICD